MALKQLKPTVPRRTIISMAVEAAVILIGVAVVIAMTAH